MNGYLTLNWPNIKSAIVYGLLMALLTFAVSVGQSILDAETLLHVDWLDVFDRGAVSVTGVMVTIVSIVKNLLTNSQGKFLGVVEVVPDKK